MSLAGGKDIIEPQLSYRLIPFATEIRDGAPITAVDLMSGERRHCEHPYRQLEVS
jgi:hypothetical protein